MHRFHNNIALSYSSLSSKKLNETDLFLLQLFRIYQVYYFEIRNDQFNEEKIMRDLRVEKTTEN